MADEESRVTEATLYSRRFENRTLRQSISWFAENLGDGYGLLYTPNSCFLTKLDKGGSLTASSGKEVEPGTLTESDLDTVFEARLFNSEAELRWWRTSDKHGPEVVLSETAGLGEAIPNIYAKIKPPNSYLLWGKSTGKPACGNDWTQFAEARIGAFFVPLKEVPSQAYARFTATEYLGEFEDGNVAIAEERLCGIEPA